MGLWGAGLWGATLPGGPGAESGGGIDTTQVIDELLPSLHAASRAELTFWSEADLIQWMDEAVKRLARITCVFVERSTSILTVAGKAIYTLPLRHVSTLHTSHLTDAIRPAATLELECLDPAYQSTQGTPLHTYQDLHGDNSFGLAPVPDTSDEVLPIVYESFPETLDAGKQNTFISGPRPLKGYLAMAVLKAAYERESEIESVDIASHCASRMAMIEQMLLHYYGAGK